MRSKFIISRCDVSFNLAPTPHLCYAAVGSPFVLFFKDGNRNKRFKAKELLLSLLILFGSLLIVTYILKPAVYVSGPTNFLARYVLLKVNPGLVDGMAMLKRYIMELMVLAFVFVYSPIILLAEYLGAKKHKKEFAAPTKGL